MRAGPIAFRDEARPLAIIYGPKRAATAITDREDNGGAADKVLASFFREVGMVRAGAAGSTVAPPDLGAQGRAQRDTARPLYRGGDGHSAVDQQKFGK